MQLGKYYFEVEHKSIDTTNMKWYMRALNCLGIITIRFGSRDNNPE
jgi:hypothetical protein